MANHSHFSEEIGSRFTVGHNWRGFKSISRLYDYIEPPVKCVTSRFRRWPRSFCYLSLTCKSHRLMKSDVPKSPCAVETVLPHVAMTFRSTLKMCRWRYMLATIWHFICLFFLKDNRCFRKLGKASDVQLPPPLLQELRFSRIRSNLWENLCKFILLPSVLSVIW